MSKLLSFLLIPLLLLINLFSSPIEKIPIPEKIIEEVPDMNDIQKCDKIIGNNSQFNIIRPDSKRMKTVHSSDFGMSEILEDNTDSFIEAIEYCRNNPGTNLIIDKGNYFFNSSGKIIINGLDSCIIDGSQAKFIVSKTGTFIQITHCDVVEIDGLSIDVDRENNPVDDVLRIKNSDSKNHTLEFEFFEKNSIEESMIFSAITQCDPDSLTFGANGSSREIYIYQNPDIIKKVEKTEENVLKISHDGSFDGFKNGETYILRHHVYDGTVFSVSGETKNLTFDSVNIFGSYGAGFTVSDLVNHYQIINSKIGVDQSCNNDSHVSLGADAIHIFGTGGFFNLENCDISGQGDDALNIHDGIGYVYDVKGNTIKMYSTQTRLNEGEYLAFKDTEFIEKNFESKIVSFKNADDSETGKEITFDCDVSKNVAIGDVVYNTSTNSGNYVIRNNYFHESRARGMLLQSDNGICENNKFYKIQGQAIKIVMDIRPNLWQEGTGVNNLIIKNNTFDACDYSCWGEQITIDSYIDGHYAQCCVFKNIKIIDNVFKNFKTKLINAMNVNGLEITGNTVDASNAANYIFIQDYCDNILINNNNCSGIFKNSASIIRSKSIKSFVECNTNK